MFLLLASTMCAGLFCGAALYVNLVEHPARMSCGQELAVREFAPSYRRATIMQVSLALVGVVLGLVAAWQLRDAWIATGAAPRSFNPLYDGLHSPYQQTVAGSDTRFAKCRSRRTPSTLESVARSAHRLERGSLCAAAPLPRWFPQKNMVNVFFVSI